MRLAASPPLPRRTGFRCRLRGLSQGWPGVPGLALRRLLAGGTAGSGARLLQDGRVTGGGELAASVRGTLIGLKKGDKEGEGESGGGLVGLADVAIAGLTQIEFRWSVALHKLQ